MSQTRPSGVHIVDDAEAAVIQESAEVDERRRFHILPRWAKRIGWLTALGENSVEALMVFEIPGRLSIRNWSPDGPRIQQRFDELSKSPDEVDLEALRLIQDRYGRININKELRPYLGDHALAHLGLPLHRGSRSLIYVAVLPSKIDLLSPAYRNEKLITGSELLDDLP